MNLLFHQLRKDLHHSRVLVGLWLILVVARFALVGWNANPDDVAMQSVYTMVSVLTLVFSFLLLLVLVPQVIHQEPLVGTTAFWFTRPLSRATLLRSKALFFLLLIVLPIVVQTIVFLVSGVTLHDAALAVPELILSQASWILILATLAVLTPGSARFIITGAVVLIACYVFIFIVEVLRLFNGHWYDLSVSPSLTGSRDILCDLLLIGFGLATVINQYLTRRTARSIVLALAGLVLSQVAAHCWPWSFLKSTVRITPDAQFHTSAIGNPDLTSNLMVQDQAALRGGEPTKTVQGTINIPGCPPGYLIKITDIWSTLETKAGRAVETGRPYANSFFNYGQPSPGPIEQALEGTSVLNMRQSSGEMTTTLFTLSADTYRGIVSSDLDYTGHITGRVYKYVSTAELPLAKGGRFVEGSNRETIVNVLKQAQGIDIQLQVQSINLLLAPPPDQDHEVVPQSLEQRPVLYVLLNRKRHEVIVQKQNSGFNFSGFSTDEILSHKLLRISFGPDNNDPQGTSLPDLNQAWLDDAVLVRLSLVPVAEFTRTLTVPNLRLDGTFRGTGQGLRWTSADVETLDKITLPANATREQTREYIMAIQRASVIANQFSDNDPQLKMLEQVGSQNVDLLIEMTRTYHSYYVNRAINDLVQDDHRDIVLQALSFNNDLIDTIIAHHWEKQAEPQLLAGLTEPNLNRNDTFALALVSLKDPATYAALKAFYIKSPNQRLYDALATLPGFDLKGMIDTTWQNRGHMQPWQVRGMLGPAFQFNEPQVIDAALTLLNDKKDAYSRKMARKALEAYTPAITTNDDELAAWIKANKDQLSFDPAVSRFVLKAPSPAPIQPPLPAPSAPK